MISIRKRLARRHLVDEPRLAAGVEMLDGVIHSTALGREMPYRVFLPAGLEPGRKLPVVYLLHGQDGHFTDWSNKSDAAQFAARGLILAMPEGHSGYYINWAKKPRKRYEDYILSELIPEIETRFPAEGTRKARAVAGVSMGGIGSVNLALRQPHLFSMAGGISSTLDAPTRAFNWKHSGQSLLFRSIFGSPGSESQRRTDPFRLAQSADPPVTPYLYLTACKAERLFETNQQFAALVKERGLAHEYHVTPGLHNWPDWADPIRGLFEKLLSHFA